MRTPARAPGLATYDAGDVIANHADLHDIGDRTDWRMRWVRGIGSADDAGCPKRPRAHHRRRCATSAMTTGEVVTSITRKSGDACRPRATYSHAAVAVPMPAPPPSMPPTHRRDGRLDLPILSSGAGHSVRLVRRPAGMRSRRAACPASQVNASSRRRSRVSPPPPLQPPLAVLVTALPPRAAKYIGAVHPSDASNRRASDAVGGFGSRPRRHGRRTRPSTRAEL